MSMREKRGLIFLLLVWASAFFPLSGEAQLSPGMMSPGIASPGPMTDGMSCPMMGPGSMSGMGRGTMPMMGMEEQGLGCRMDFLGILHRWKSLCILQRIPLGISGAQLDEIEILANNHLKYSIQKEADLKLLLLEVRNLLVRDKVDLVLIENSHKDQGLESIRI